jgi:hypothetical protein
MNLPWPFATKREFAVTILVAIIVIAVVAVVLVKFPNPYQASSNWGFGPEWHCSYPGGGEPVCVKETSEKPPN